MCFAAAACGDGSADTTGSTGAVNRDALIGQLLKAVRGTVGAAGTPCVRTYLRARTDDELDRLLNDAGTIDEGDRAFTAAVIACSDG